MVLCCGCSTKKNTPATRAYHELTTRYNIYFNAEEAYQEILKNRLDDSQEDYAGLIPVYPPITVTGKPTAGGPFDPVIEKTEKAIGEHSITAKPRRDPSKAHSQEYRQWLRQEEFNPFLKNVWLLRGKAYLQNGNYDEALSIFSGMLRLYSHDRELTDETEIWMLRAYTEMERSYEAEKIVYALKNKQFPKQLGNLFAGHYTSFLIRENRFKQAIPYLQKTIAQETYTPQKQRLQFLLGQLFVVTGEKNKAFQAFERVKGLNTPFEITLNATLWQSAITTGEQQRDIMRRLKKMAQKVNDTDSAAFADRRHRIYLKAGNDSLARVFHPSAPDSGLVHEAATAIAVTDTNSRNQYATTDTPQRLSRGRTLAENAALHRQWRSRNGLWQSLTAGSTGMAVIEKMQAIPFNPDKSGLHYLLLTFTADGENADLAANRVNTPNEENEPIRVNTPIGENAHYSANKNRLLFAVADFNFTHFKLRKFNTSYIYLPGAEALQIEPFRSLDEASLYMEMMLSDTLFSAAQPIAITPVIISGKNLQLILSGKKMNEYITFYTENLTPTQTTIHPENLAPTKATVHPTGVDKTAEIEKKIGQKPEKVVSLEILPDTTTLLKESNVLQEQAQTGTVREKVHREQAQTDTVQPYERETPEALKRRLEENAAKALQKQQETAPRESREQLLKERQRQREEKIRQRERDLKERQRKREAALKQREKERIKKIERQR